MQLICTICCEPIMNGQAWIQLGTVMVGNGEGSQRVIKEHEDSSGCRVTRPEDDHTVLIGPVLHTGVCLEQWIWGVAATVTEHYRGKTQ